MQTKARSYSGSCVSANSAHSQSYRTNPSASTRWLCGSHMSYYILNEYVSIYGVIEESGQRAAKMYAERYKIASSNGILRVDRLPPLSWQVLMSIQFRTLVDEHMQTIDPDVCAVREAFCIYFATLRLVAIAAL